MDLEKYKEIVKRLDKGVVLRHDVDFSIEAALQIAEIDNENSINSYFYLRFNCEYYKVDEEVIAKFLRLGRFVGAHISVSDINLDFGLCGLLDRTFAHTKSMLRKKRFTFHINNEETQKYQKGNYGKYINMNIIEPGHYISDSRGIIPDIPDGFTGVLNLHPEWWVYPGETPQQKIEYYFNQKKERCLREILPDLHS